MQEGATARQALLASPSRLYFGGAVYACQVHVGPVSTNTIYHNVKNISHGQDNFGCSVPPGQQKVTPNYLNVEPVHVAPVSEEHGVAAT